jgi:phage gp46-like protein
MNDIALVWDPEQGAADIVISGNDLLSDDGLETAVLMSLFLDARAEVGDVLFDGTDRRGWWGDSVPVVDSDKIGSRLWLLDRAKAIATTFAQAEDFARQALQWFVDDGVASAVSTTATATGPTTWELVVAIERPGRDTASFKFTGHWAAQEGK